MSWRSVCCFERISSGKGDDTGLKGIRQSYPALTSEDLDALALAFIEGDSEPSGMALDKPREVLESLEKPITSNMQVYAWGFTYWGYRKCYGAAAVLAVAFFALCLLCAHIRSVIPMVAFVAICGAAFNPYYRSRIYRKVNRALLAEGGSVERAKERLRAEGGTDSLAYGATAALTLVCIAIVVAGYVLFPVSVLA